jgi:hypothetical protein
MESQAVVKTRLGKFDKVCHRVGCVIGVKTNLHHTLGGVYLCFFHMFDFGEFCLLNNRRKMPMFNHGKGTKRF